METLPSFKYHPDPVKTGSIIESGAICECCELARGYVYTESIYAEEEIQYICPWCISSGEAATKFDGEFVDSLPLSQAGISRVIIDEVSLRTPSYESWQQESWLSCCNDACEFHGDASKEELRDLTQSELIGLSKETSFSFDVLTDMISRYEPKGSPAFYRFVCRQCAKVKFGCDFH